MILWILADILKLEKSTEDEQIGSPRVVTNKNEIIGMQNVEDRNNTDLSSTCKEKIPSKITSRTTTSKVLENKEASCFIGSSVSFDHEVNYNENCTNNNTKQSDHIFKISQHEEQLGDERTQIIQPTMDLLSTKEYLENPKNRQQKEPTHSSDGNQGDIFNQEESIKGTKINYKDSTQEDQNESDRNHKSIEHTSYSAEQKVQKKSIASSGASTILSNYLFFIPSYYRPSTDDLDQNHIGATNGNIADNQVNEIGDNTKIDTDINQKWSAENEGHVNKNGSFDSGKKLESFSNFKQQSL